MAPMGPEIRRHTQEEDEAMLSSSPCRMSGARYFGHLGSTLSFVSDVRLVADSYDELHAERNREQHGIETQPPVGSSGAASWTSSTSI